MHLVMIEKTRITVAKAKLFLEEKITQIDGYCDNALKQQSSQTFN